MPISWMQDPAANRVRRPFLVALITAVVLAFGLVSADSSRADGGQCNKDSMDFSSSCAYIPQPLWGGNPMAGWNWFLDKQWSSIWTAYRHSRGGERFLLEKIAFQPQMKDWGNWDPHPYSDPRGGYNLRTYLNRAEQSGGQMVMVGLTGIEHQSCPYSARKAVSLSRYKAWIDEATRAIGSHRVLVNLENDRLPTMECLPGWARKRRLAELKYAVAKLSKLPNTTTYIDAGASDWAPWKVMARYLRIVGIGRVRGFALNSSHWDRTDRNVRFGMKIVGRLHTHFIVSTKQNGRGPGRRHGGGIDWFCNPPQAGLGKPPTLRTANPAVDGYLWLSQPGYSDGACNGWRVSAGQFSKELALRLARRADF